MPLSDRVPFCAESKVIGRVELRTGSYRMADSIPDYKDTRIPEEVIDLPDSEKQVPETAIGLSLLEIVT